MSEFIVPANIILGKDSGSQSGVGTALGQVALISGLSGSPGVDAIPPTVVSALGQPGYHSIGFPATDMDGDDANRQPAAFRRALAALVVRGGSGVVIIRNGVPVNVLNCAAVFAMASARYFVDPSDVGLGPGQIPPTPATLMASQLDGHPAAFVRRADRVRGVVSQQLSTIPASPLIAIQQAVVAACPVEVFTVNRPPTFSTWALGIDGVTLFVAIQHPVGSNFRRPADIWNNVLAPLIAAANSDTAAVTAFAVATFGPGNVFTERGLLTRLNYVEYARFIAPLDSATAGMTTSLYPP